MDEDECGPGVLLYGYTKAQAEQIKAYLSSLAGQDVAVIGGGGKEGAMVGDILEGSEGEGFAAGEPKVLMFLGFDDDAIEAVLRTFPKDGFVPRPIFCCPTEENVAWTLEYLMEHLLEERRCFAERESAAKR
jgi:hypothetical protein